MKRLIVAMLLVLAMVTVSHAQKTCDSSGLLTYSSVVSTVPGTICGITVIADGTNAATAIVYDNNVGVATGKVLWKSTAAAGEYLTGGLYPNIIRSNTGLYVAISGTGASAIVYYNAQ
jgi:hypothetical protein